MLHECSTRAPWLRTLRTKPLAARCRRVDTRSNPRPPVEEHLRRLPQPPQARVLRRQRPLPRVRRLQPQRELAVLARQELQTQPLRAHLLLRRLQPQPQRLGNKREGNEGDEEIPQTK